MLNKEIIVRIFCKEKIIPGIPCEFGWMGTPEEYNDILNMDETILNIHPHKKLYKALKENKCPYCSQEQNFSEKQHPPGGIRKPRYWWPFRRIKND